MAIRWIAIAVLLCGCGGPESGAAFDDPGDSGGAGGTAGADSSGEDSGGSGGSATLGSSAAQESASSSTGGAAIADSSTGSDSTTSTTGAISTVTTSAGGASSSSTNASSSTTGSVEPDPVPGCNTVPISQQCENGADRGSYSCPDGEAGYYATDGRRWTYPAGSGSEEILCVLLDHTKECLGTGNGCVDSSTAGTTASSTTTGASTTGGVMPPASLPGCETCDSFDMYRYCYWHPVDFPEGKCSECPMGWHDCDGPTPEYEGWAGGPETGCETRESELNEDNACGECGPDANTCDCDVDGNCSGGW